MGLNLINASNGSGEAVRASVTALRTAGSSTITVNTTTNWPTNFIATSGTQLPDGSLDPNTALVFKGHKVSGTSIVIDSLAPGYIDSLGSAVNNLVVLKPTTLWADTVASAFDATSVNSVYRVIYPVGSVYINAGVSTNPATLFGFGTWSAFGAGRVMVGMDASQPEFDTLAETGGAKTHTLTLSEIPSHDHGVGGDYTHRGGTGYSHNAGNASWNFSTEGTISAQGGGSAHNNLQPYITVYMWKRTA